MIWSKLKYFTRDENWGEPDRMDTRLLLKLDYFRQQIQTPVIVLCGTNGTHVANSEHYKGTAVDVAVPRWGGNLLDLYFEADRFGFGGIGLYPDWQINGKKAYGLHLDVRETYGRWIGVGKPQKYLGLNSQNIQKFLLF